MIDTILNLMYLEAQLPLGQRQGGEVANLTQG